MPIYEYTCSSCHKLSDVLQKLNEPPPPSCPACGAEGTLSRVVSRTSFVLKGGGWGADLYAKKAPETGAPKADEAPKPQPKDGAPAAAQPASGGTASGGTAGASPSPSPPSSSSKGNSG